MIVSNRVTELRSLLACARQVYEARRYAREPADIVERARLLVEHYRAELARCLEPQEPTT